MDFHNQMQNNIQNNTPIYVRPIPQKENGMSTAAMATGITGAVSLLFLPFFPFLPFILTSTSIVLALLSKGRNKKALSPCKGRIYHIYLQPCRHMSSLCIYLLSIY